MDAPPQIAPHPRRRGADGVAAAFTRAPPPPPPRTPRTSALRARMPAAALCVVPAPLLRGLGTPTRRAFMGPTATISVHPRPSSVSRTTRAAAAATTSGSEEAPDQGVPTKKIAYTHS
ncbi:hypothetical protein FB451DRAFT_1388180 [Mycena latifolia]|nr:hypothetical protein FB451DRAFT_1388180 [Mycena latifolia]